MSILGGLLAAAAKGFEEIQKKTGNQTTTQKPASTTTTNKPATSNSTVGSRTTTAGNTGKTNTGTTNQTPKTNSFLDKYNSMLDQFISEINTATSKRTQPTVKLDGGTGNSNQQKQTVGGNTGNENKSSSGNRLLDLLNGTKDYLNTYSGNRSSPTVKAEDDTPGTTVHEFKENGGRFKLFDFGAFYRPETMNMIDPQTYIDNMDWMEKNRNKGYFDSWVQDFNWWSDRKQDEYAASLESQLKDLYERIGGGGAESVRIPEGGNADEINGRVQNFLTNWRTKGVITTTDPRGKEIQYKAGTGLNETGNQTQIAQDAFRYIYGEDAFLREMDENGGTLSDESRREMTGLLGKRTDMSEEEERNTNARISDLQARLDEINGVIKRDRAYSGLIDDARAKTAENGAEGGYIKENDKATVWNTFGHDKVTSLYSMFGGDGSLIYEGVAQNYNTNIDEMEEAVNRFDHAFFYLPEEKSIFQDYVNAGDREGALAFHQGLVDSGVLNFRYMQWEKDRMQLESDINPIATGISTVFGQKMQPFYAIATQAARLLGDRSAEDKNSNYNYLSNYIETTRSNITGNFGKDIAKWTKNATLGKLGELVAQGVFSGLDSGLDYVIGKGFADVFMQMGLIQPNKWTNAAQAASLGTMFLEVFQNSYTRALDENDGDGNYATITALLDAGSEIFWETIGGADFAFREGESPAKYVLMTYLGELIEEEGGNLTEPIINTVKDNLYQYATTGQASGQNQWDKDAQALRLANPAKYAGEDGINRSYIDAAENFGKKILIETPISTAASTLPKAGGTGYQINYGNGQTGKQIVANDSLNDLINIAMQSSNMDTAAWGQKLKNRMDAGQKISNTQIGRLFAALGAENNQNIRTVSGRVMEQNIRGFLKDTYTSRDGQTQIDDRTLGNLTEIIRKAAFDNGSLSQSDREMLAKYPAAMDLMNDLKAYDQGGQVDPMKRSSGMIGDYVQQQKQAAKGLMDKANQLYEIAKTDTQRHMESVREEIQKIEKAKERAGDAVRTAADKMADGETVKGIVGRIWENAKARTAEARKNGTLGEETGPKSEEEVARKTVVFTDEQGQKTGGTLVRVETKTVDAEPEQKAGPREGLSQGYVAQDADREGPATTAETAAENAPAAETAAEAAPEAKQKAPSKKRLVRQYVVRTADGTEIRTDAVTAKAADASTAAAMTYIETSDMSDQEATDLLDVVTGQGIKIGDMEALLKDARNVMTRGWLGDKFPAEIGYSPEAARALYEKGQKQKIVDEETRKGGRKTTLNPGNGQVTYRGFDVKTLEGEVRKQVEAAAAIAKRVGYNIIFENDTKNTNRYGEYDAATGSVIINIAGKNGRGQAHHLMVAMSHEVTHLLEHNSPEAYAQLRDFVFAEMKRNGVDLVARIGQKVDNYNYQIRQMRQNGRNISDITIGGAAAEVVADACDQVFGNEKLITRLANENPTLFDKVKNAIADFIGKVRDAARGMQESGSFDSANIRDMDKLAEKWGIALEDVRNGGRAAGTQQNAGNAAETQQNQLSVLGVDEITGRTIYLSNFSAEKNKLDKAAHGIKLIQDVWSKNKIPLRVHDGTNPEGRIIYAQFDPDYDTTGQRMTDAGKIVRGNRIGNRAERRMAINLLDDYIDILKESRYHGTEPNRGGHNPQTHTADITAWHYFLDDLYYVDQGSDEMIPFEMEIDIKEKADGAFVYNFGGNVIEGEQIKRLSMPQFKTAGSNPQGKAHAQSDIILNEETENNNIKSGQTQNSLAEMDEQYMAAAKSGDTETAARMVEEAAQKAGYTDKAYHGTTAFGFTKFDMEEGRGDIFVAFTKNIASTYTKTNADVRGLKDETRDIRTLTGDELFDLAFENGITVKDRKGKDVRAAISTGKENGTYTLSYRADYFDLMPTTETINTKELRELVRPIYEKLQKNGVYQLYTRPGRQLVIDAHGFNWDTIPFDRSKNSIEEMPVFDENDVIYDYSGDTLQGDRTINGPTAKTRQIARWAKAHGYDSVRINNVVDTGGYSGEYEDGRGDIGIFFNEQAVKSADPVTYDNQGNVIPLSERFKQENNDIRFSLREQKNIEGTTVFPAVDAIDKTGNVPSTKTSINENEWTVNPGEAYRTAVQNGDLKTATAILLDKLKNTDGITGFIAPHWDAGKDRAISRLIKTGAHEAIAKAAADMAVYVPDNAVLIPMPDHTGKVTEDTDTAILARAISELTGKPVFFALEGAERESRYKAKSEGRKGIGREGLDFRQVLDIPEGSFPVFVDNVVGTGITAEAAQAAFGGGITLAYAKTTRARGLEGLKNAIVTYDRNGDIIPLEDRFDREKRDVRFSLADISEIQEKQQDLIMTRERVHEIENSKELQDAITKAMKEGNFDDYNEIITRTKLADLKRKVSRLEDEIQTWQKEYAEERNRKNLSKEQQAIAKSGLTEPEYRNRQAVKHFGTTTNPMEAGYIIRNGSMLNFSGEKGKHYGYRASDHREIGTIYEDDNIQGSGAMVAFMNDGNVRVMPESTGIDISNKTEPTAEQYRAIRRLVNEWSRDGEFAIDFSDEQGNNIDSIVYEGRISADKVIADIKHFYETGEVRQPSELSRFFSVAENGMAASDWIMAMDPNDIDMGTKAEKALVRNYQKTRREVESIEARIAEMKEALKTAKGDDARKLRINLQTEQNKLKRARDMLNGLTSGREFSYMLRRAQESISYLMGMKSQEDVNRAADRMRDKAEEMRRTATEAAGMLEKIADREEIAVQRRYFNNDALRGAAAELGEYFGIKDTSRIEDGLVEIGLKMIAKDPGFAESLDRMSSRILEDMYGTAALMEGSNNKAVYGSQLSDITVQVLKATQKYVPGMKSANITTADRAEVQGLLDYVKQIGSMTRQAAKGMQRVAGMAQELKQQTEGTKAATAEIRRKLATAIRYYDNLNKQSDALASAERMERTIRQIESKAAQQVLEAQMKFAHTLENDRNVRRLANENLRERHKINTAYKRMAKLILNESDQKNIPAHMQPIARAAIRMILNNDTSGRKLTGQDWQTLIWSRNTLELIDKRDGTELNLNALVDFELIDQGGDDVAVAIEEALQEIDEGIRYWNSGNGRTAVALEGDKAALARISKGMTQIYDIVTRSQQIFLDGKQVDLANAAYEVDAEARKKGPYREFTGGLGKLVKGMNKNAVLANMTPEYFFKNLKNNGLSRIFDEFKNGEDRYGRILLEAKKKIEAAAEKAGYSSWDMDAKHAIQLDNGRTVNMTLGQMMSLMATWKRENTLGPEMSQHLTKGGFVIEEKSEKKIYGRESKNQTPNRVTEHDMEEIGNMLTAEQKTYVDEMVQILTKDMGRYGNEASMRMYGIEKYKETYYFPFQIWSGVKNKDSAAGSVNPTNNNRAAHMSFTNRRKANASNAVMIRDFNQVCAEHINQMATYATFGSAIEGMNRVLNYRIMETGEDGIVGAVERNIENLLVQQYGEDAVNYLRQFMKDLNGGAVQKNTDIGQRLMSMFKKNAVGGSLSVALQQPLSYIRASTMIEVKNLQRAEARCKAHIMSREWWKNEYAEMAAHSGVAVIKDMGKFDMSFSMGAADWLTPDNRETGIRKVYNKVEEITNALPEKMDQITWIKMWNAIKIEQAAANPGVDQQSDEFLDAVGKRFNDVMRKTQVYDSVLVKSELMRNTGWVAKTITAFRAEPTVTLNMFMDAWMNRKEAGGKKNAAAVMATFLLGAIAQAAVKGIMGAGRNPDEKKTLAENFAYRFGSAFMSEANPLGLIPGMDNIITALSGNDINDNAWGMIKTFSKSLKTIWNLPTGEKLTLDSGYRYIEDTVGQITQMMSGVPAKNLMRDSRAVYNWFLGEGYSDREHWGKDKDGNRVRIPGRERTANDISVPLLGYANRNVMKYQLFDQLAGDNLMAMLNATTGLNVWDSSSTAYTQRIYEAERDGNRDAADAYREYMTLGKGKEKKDIDSAVASAAKKDSSLTTVQKAEFLLENEYTDKTSWITEQYKKGELTEEETRKLYGKYFPDKNPDDMMWNYEAKQYKEGGISQAEAKAAYMKYHPKKKEQDWNDWLWGIDSEKFREGNMTEAEAKRSYLQLHPKKNEQDWNDYLWSSEWKKYKEGTISEAEAKRLYQKYHPNAKEKDMASTFWGLWKTAYKDGEISRAEAERRYKQYYPKANADDIFSTFDALDYTKDTGKTASGDYYRMHDAIEQNNSAEIAKAVESLTKHGKKKNGFESSIKGKWMTTYNAMQNGSAEKVRLRDGITKAMKAAGFSTKEIDKMFTKWAKTAEKEKKK